MAVEVLVILVLWNIQEGEGSVVVSGVRLGIHIFVFYCPQPPNKRYAAVGAGYCVFVGRGAWTCYAAGIKQSREPMLAVVIVAAQFVFAYASPAFAPLCAEPPNKTPLIATPEAGILV